MQKRLFLQAIAAALATAVFSPALLAQDKPKIPVEVWKDPNCGCCQDWVVYLEANGFAVKVHDTGNAAVRAKLKIAEQFGSCHTALIGGYAIEGHVPVREINRLLKERPKAIGISVPGMPVGTPGMDAPIYQGREDAYSVLLLAHGGGSSVYQSYPGKAQTAAPIAAASAPAAVEMADGEIRKIDKEAKKITLRHGFIKSIDMPPMTMVFRVKDVALLDKAKVGDKVRFQAEDNQGALTITAMELPQGVAK